MKNIIVVLVLVDGNASKFKTSKLGKSFKVFQYNFLLVYSFLSKPTGTNQRTLNNLRRKWIAAEHSPKGFFLDDCAMCCCCCSVDILITLFAQNCTRGRRMMFLAGTENNYTYESADEYKSMEVGWLVGWLWPIVKYTNEYTNTYVHADRSQHLIIMFVYILICRRLECMCIDST